MGDGAKANRNGKKLEDLFESILKKYNISYKKQVKYIGIYGNTSKMDFYLTDYDCAIEIKNQTGSGSVWEKLPHVMHSLSAFPSKQGALFCGDVKSINESRSSWWEDKGSGAINWAHDHAKSMTKKITVLHFKDAENFIKNLGIKNETKNIA